MAAYYKLYGLQFVFICMLASSALRIVEEPWTDKPCYKPHDKGILSTKVYFPDSLDPLDWYTIAWNPNHDGTGAWFINGSACLIYKASSDDIARWKATFEYDYRYMSYTMEVKNMKLGDQTPELYALVINRTTDQIVARSTGTAQYIVKQDCTNNVDSTAPNTKETDSSISSSTLTSVPSLQEEKKDSSSISTGKYHAATYIPFINLCAGFITLILGIQLILPDLYDFTRELFRRLGRGIGRKLQFPEVRQRSYELPTPEENDALNNEPSDIVAQ